MSLNSTASADRIHIAFFGMTNAGKSSIVNAVTGQDLAVVSPIKGTTTDPVKKTMELLPLGPVVIIDTPGLDDEGALGSLRVKKARGILSQTDIAVLVVDSARSLTDADRELISLFNERELPFIVALNKADLLRERHKCAENEIYVSALTGENITELKEKLAAFSKDKDLSKRIIGDLLSPGDCVVLVMPIDEAAPKGRLILPQQQTMRDVLDSHCTFIACQDTELKEALENLAKKPKMVVTDSQAFERVARDTPEDIMLTSFSILFARYRGNLETLVKGAAALSRIGDGDKILISEGCTHHRQCNDIGTVKLPGWIEKFTGAKPRYCFSSGGGFPEELAEYKLIIHCGACMINEKEMQSRIARAEAAGVPIVNYGIAIAHMHGILARSLEPFPDIKNILTSIS